MAELTVTLKHFEVMGARRVVTAKAATINNNDTWTTGLAFINAFQATAGTATAIGGTVVGGVITFATGGATTNVQLQAEGI